MATTSLPTLDVRVSDAQAAFVAGDARYSLMLGGIGAGKTYAGAIKALRHLRPNTLGLVVAPSFRMLRDATWRTSLDVWRGFGLAEQVLRGDELRVVLANGAEALFRSAEDPERLRGPNASWAWIDEGALCRPETWTVTIGRLREHGVAGPCWVTTTPKPRDIGSSSENWTRRVFVTGATDETAIYHARTAANPFLPAAFARSLRSQYTARLARQELDAEWLLDVEGSLWHHGMISRAPAPSDLRRVVVAVDPSGGSDPEHDEQGIVVAGLGADGRGYVLADRSCRLSPDGWGRRAVQAYLEVQADAIVGEANYGGDMVQAVISTAARAMGVTGVTYKPVQASRGKAVRAQPVAACYEQGRISHCGVFPELEEQLVTWTPESGTSPDRMDAAVWALTELLVKEQRQVYVW